MTLPSHIVELWASFGDHPNPASEAPLLARSEITRSAQPSRTLHTRPKKNVGHPTLHAQDARQPYPLSSNSQGANVTCIASEAFVVSPGTEVSVYAHWKYHVSPGRIWPESSGGVA